MDDEKALQLAREYDQAVLNSERWEDFKERSQRGEDYYSNLQTWSTEQKTQFANEGKPCLTFNEILPILNYLTSVERDNRKDAKVEAGRGGFDSVAELLTSLCKHAMYLSEGDFVKSEVFLNGIRGVTGYFKLEICYDQEPITGQLILRSRPPLSVRTDPACMTYNLNDKHGAQFVIDTEYIARDRLKALYPKKADDLDAVMGDYIGRGKKGIITRTIDYLFGNLAVEGEGDDEVLFDRDMMAKWRCRHSETYFKEFVSRTLIVDKRNWEIRWVNTRKPAEAALLEQFKQIASQYPQVYEIQEKTPMPLLHCVRRVGPLLLEHVEDPYNGMTLFPIVPFSPLGQAQYDMGMVDNLVGPQDELNKRMTNAVHILGQTANGGMVIGSAKDPAYLRTLRDFGSSPNIVIELDKCGGHWEKIQPNQPATGYIQLQGIDRNYLEEISGVTGSSRGYDPSRQESGRLYREKVKQSMSTNQIIYDRFDWSVQILYQTTAEMLRRLDVYTEQEIGKIIDDEKLLSNDILDEARQMIMQQYPPPRQPNQQAVASLGPKAAVVIQSQFNRSMEQYQQMAEPKAIELAKQKLFKQYKDINTGKYSVIVIQSPNAPTTQISNFYELEAMKGMLPPEILAPHMIRATGLPKDSKDEIIEKIEAMTAAPAAAQGVA